MNVSVVIATFNRVENIKDTLASLARQTYAHFEIIVVNGPSTDGTAQFLDGLKGRVKVVDTEFRNLSISRNLGIDHAAGDIVAFIDDDGIADPCWLQELVEAYDAPEIGGVGGVVYDHTGSSFQFRYSACYRRGEGKFDFDDNHEDYIRAGADPFLYLQGTNCSFQRSALVEIGGFDERIEYYYDETDLCVRLIDAGRKLRALDRAGVIHRYAKSHVRNAARIVFDPYTTVKNQHLFALTHGPTSQPLEQVYHYLGDYTNLVLEGARWHLRTGNFTAQQSRYFLDRVTAGIRAGVAASKKPRSERSFRLQASNTFSPFSSAGRALQRILNIVYISRELPPDQIGGIGRFTLDTALAIARLGHVVHIVTRGSENSIDYREGVYIHFVKYLPPDPALSCNPIGSNIAHMFSIYNYVKGIQSRFVFDIISYPNLATEGLPFSLEKMIPTVLTLHTTVKATSELHPSERLRPETAGIIALEHAAFESADLVQFNSHALAEKTVSNYGQVEKVIVVPHGIDRPTASAVKVTEADSLRPEGNVFLYVGRLDHRNGVDILLAAIEFIYDSLTTKERAQLRFTLVGNNSPNFGLDISFKDDFETRRADIMKDRFVFFTGEVSNLELSDLYQTSDVLVVPSRFDSFGLVSLEAMSHGLPVIASDNSGVGEVVTDQYGLLFRPEDCTDLAERILLLNTDVALRRRLGENARVATETTFSIDAIARRLVGAYQDVIHRFDARAFEPRDVALEFARAVAPTSGIAESDLLRAARLTTRQYTADKIVADIMADLEETDGISFVDRIYHVILGRPCEHALDNGLADSLLTDAGGRLSFITNLLDSAEARRNIGNAALRQEWSKRSDGPNAERRDPGEVEEDVFKNIVDQITVAIREYDDAEFINALYQSVLRRPCEFLVTQETAHRILAEAGGRVTYATRLIGSPEANALNGHCQLQRSWDQVLPALP